MTDGLKPKQRSAIIEILAANPRVERAVLFGSRAMGTFTSTSDVDMALFGNALTLSDQAGLSQAMSELSVPQRVDILIHHRIESRTLLNHIRQHGVEWFARKSPTTSPSAMANDGWNQHRLADLCDSIDYGFTTSASEEPVGPKFLRITDIVGGCIDWNTVPYCEIEPAQKATYRLHVGDVVIARTGATTGYSAYLSAVPDAVFASYLVRLKVRDPNNPRFVAYYLKGRQFWDYMYGVLGDKSAQPNASATTLTQAPITVPPPDVQHRIADVLGTLDDKIELNRRMNRTLEKMAAAIFKSWFIDFDPVHAKAAPGNGRDTGLPAEIADLFPNTFEDSAVGPIPKGWAVSKFGDLIELAYGKSLRAQDRRPGPVAVYGSNGQVGWHDTALVTGPGIVVGRKGNPGIVTWAPSEFFPIDTTFYVVPTGPICSLYFLYHALKNHNLASLGADSAVPGLNRNMAYMSQQVVPTSDLITVFDSFVKPLFDRIHACERQNRRLAGLRDTLLPKLLSGEIELPEFQREIEGASHA